MGDIKAVSYAVIVGIGACCLGGFAWLAWSASRATKYKADEAKAVKDANHVVKIEQAASQASANSFNSDKDLEGALENGSF